MLLIGKKPWSYHAYLPCLRCPSPLFTILFCVFDDGFAHFRAYFSLQGVVWDAWLTGGRAVYSAECLRVMWLGGLIVV